MSRLWGVPERLNGRDKSAVAFIFCSCSQRCRLRAFAVSLRQTPRGASRQGLALPSLRIRALACQQGRPLSRVALSMLDGQERFLPRGERRGVPAQNDIAFALL